MYLKVVGIVVDSEGAGRANARKPAKPSKKKEAGPCFQYLTMEFAEGGDMEEAMKALPKQAWPHEYLPTLMYQMLFSMYAAQRELTLRHYDVKLLNFFLASPKARLPPVDCPAVVSGVSLRRAPAPAGAEAGASAELAQAQLWLPI